MGYTNSGTLCVPYLMAWRNRYSMGTIAYKKEGEICLIPTKSHMHRGHTEKTITTSSQWEW